MEAQLNQNRAITGSGVVSTVWRRGLKSLRRLSTSQTSSDKDATTSPKLPEAVRLVIWDLDETFWQGTLVEGGVVVGETARDIVIELARRGIISSICSKNDFTQVQALLESIGVWDYFVFPSINWEPKGPRIAALVNEVQLRPATVMFIDDNPLNLQEACHFMPGIQVSGPEIINDMLKLPLFTGKDDVALTRLKQYKTLALRQANRAQPGVDVSVFLRDSDIRVQIVRDIDLHIERVVELINRTNQLNFTKLRLPEDSVEAIEQIRSLLRRHDIQAGLIHVSDRYGDHGLVGIYVFNSEQRRLLHFCFSCRILGMGVEQWLYALLGRPAIAISGEVISDLKSPGAVDWINQERSEALDHASGSKLCVDALVARGGCDLSAVTHYLGSYGLKVTGEFNIVREGVALRTDHSVFIPLTSRALSEDEMSVARRLLYNDSDFHSATFAEDHSSRAFLFSFATDAHHALYQHRATGLVLPCMIGLGPTFKDARKHDILELPEGQRSSKRADCLRFLKEEFDFLGILGEQQFKQNIRMLFVRVNGSRCFVLRPLDFHTNKANGQRYPSSAFLKMNEWTKDVAEEFPAVELVDLVDFVEDPTESDSILHHHRKVYYQVYQHIVKRLSA